MIVTRAGFLTSVQDLGRTGFRALVAGVERVAACIAFVARGERKGENKGEHRFDHQPALIRNAGRKAIAKP